MQIDSALRFTVGREKPNPEVVVFERNFLVSMSLLSWRPRALGAGRLIRQPRLPCSGAHLELAAGFSDLPGLPLPLAVELDQLVTWATDPDQVL